jgi:hypothetical protein
MKKTILSLISILFLTFVCLSQTNSDSHSNEQSKFIKIDESKVIPLEITLTGTVVFSLSNPVNFYLVNSGGEVLKSSNTTNLISFYSEDLPSGFYHMILESDLDTNIYKLTK